MAASGRQLRMTRYFNSTLIRKAKAFSKDSIHNKLFSIFLSLKKNNEQNTTLNHHRV